MALLEVVKALVAGWVAYGLSTRFGSRWAKAAIFTVAAILGQVAAFETGYLLVLFELPVLKATDVAKSMIIPWSSLATAGVGLYLGRPRA
ncbi:hypothetical protein [Bradyrhizobium sp. CB2312]|uniref:hypothetical protein n=1 Tax=Bradyrhizobium sp. CB2312 TaxID=3039155 RepID=UPI0024B1E184|nr:hypothetical protein [Bradyrhizobium sp. CB2312]WFU76578.1 hypothetical protein QA642_22510 [Bradyrhizobium sp. CB2312]